MENYGKLEQGLLQAMKAIENQIARAMQRSPSERDLHGVQKWEPYASRVEGVAAFLLQEVGDANIGLDSLLVCAQAFTKALRLICDDMGQDGLGQVRSAYCLDAMDKINRDAQMVVAALSDAQLV
jgi:hypothetical protein